MGLIVHLRMEEFNRHLLLRAAWSGGRRSAVPCAFTGRPVLQPIQQPAQKVLQRPPDHMPDAWEPVSALSVRSAVAEFFPYFHCCSYHPKLNPDKLSPAEGTCWWYVRPTVSRDPNWGSIQVWLGKMLNLNPLQGTDWGRSEPILQPASPL